MKPYEVTVEVDVHGRLVVHGRDRSDNFGASVAVTVGPVDFVGHPADLAMLFRRALAELDRVCDDDLLAEALAEDLR